MTQEPGACIFFSTQLYNLEGFKKKRKLIAQQLVTSETFPTLSQELRLPYLQHKNPFSSSLPLSFEISCVLRELIRLWAEVLHYCVNVWKNFYGRASKRSRCLWNNKQQKDMQMFIAERAFLGELSCLTANTQMSL